MVSAGVACCSKNTIRRDTMKKVLLIALLAMLAVGMVFASGSAEQTKAKGETAQDT